MEMVYNVILTLISICLLMVSASLLAVAFRRTGDRLDLSKIPVDRRMK